MMLQRIIILGFIFIFAFSDICSQPFLPVEFTIDQKQGFKGDQVCLDVRVKNFERVQSITFNISFNSNLLRLIEPVDISNSALNIIGPNIISDGSFAYNKKQLGVVKFLWFYVDPSLPNGITLPDGSLLFTVCFDLIGDPGNISPVYVNGQQIFSDVCQVGNDGKEICTENYNSVTGTIKIISPTLDAYFSTCDEDSNNPGSNGSVTFYATGGTPPYSYTINPGPINNTIASDGERRTLTLPKGSYTLTINDSGGSPVVNKNFVISDNLPLKVQEVLIKKTTCANNVNGNGKIIIKAQDGAGPYTYQWSNFVFGVDSIVDLRSGIYSVTVTDRNGLGCSVVRSWDLTAIPLNFDIAIKDTASCKTINVRDGSIEIKNITGGTPFDYPNYNFVYQINNTGSVRQFLNSTIAPNIGTGTVRVSVSDSVGCRVEKEIFMPFKYRITFDTLIFKDITCNGKNDGAIRIRPKPQGNYSYPDTNLPGGGFSIGGAFDKPNISAGRYFVVTRDNKGCRDTFNFEIKEPDPIVLNPTVVQPDCVNPGSITLNPTGGTGAYTYTWNPPAIGNVNALTGLSGGSYTVSVTDANNCTATPFSVQLNPQGALNITTVIKQPISCIGKNDAVVIVEIGSANGPFNVTWRDATNTIISNMTQVSNLGPGVYTVVVSDNNSCSNSKTVTIDPGSDFTLTTTLSNAPCFDQNGKVEASVSGNSTGFKYEWRVKGQSAIIDNDNTLDAKAGTYTVKAISPAGCEKETDVTITEPAAITFPAPETRNVTCFGLSDGAARILNGPSNINYSWSNGTSGIFTINLPIGNAWVVGSVGSCKSDTVRFNIGTFPKLQLDLNKTQVVDPICFGDKNGSVTVEATGGTGISYTYTWRNGVSGPTLTNIGAGTYILDIGDSNNCIQTDTFILTQPSELVASLDKSKSVELDCNNQTGGKLALMTTGGNPGIKTITWQSGVTTNGNIAIDLNPGTYCATISDNFGCRDTFCYTLVAPAPLVGELNIPEEPKCFGDKTCISVKSISGGTGNKYTFQIITGGTRYPIGDCVDVFAGTYSVILIDSAGCDIRKEITIRQPNPIIVELGDDVEVQLGLPTPTITASVTDNVGNTQLVWTPSEGITCLTTDCLSIEANPTQTTTYLLTVTDQNGCTGTDNITVNVKNLRNVYFANAFSPNNDGFNDHFQAIIGPGVEKILTFAIYDRWGGQVFLQENYVPDPAQTDGWNGTFGNTGRKLDPGVFVYYARARFIDGKEIEYKGTITLMDKTRN